MTREEQIIEKAGKDSEIFYKVNDNYGDCFHGGFIDGAKWADANPQFSKEEFIEKAEEWLWNNFYEHPHERWLICSESFDTIEYMIERFKAAMEE